MKTFVSCNVEMLFYPGEAAWIISVSMDAVSDTALLLSGMIYKKVNRIKFADKSHTAILSADTQGYVLNLDGEQITVTKVWLEAVLGLLLDVCLNGWTVTSHLDEDFEKTSVTIAVLPPDK